MIPFYKEQLVLIKLFEIMKTTSRIVEGILCQKNLVGCCTNNWK